MAAKPTVGGSTGSWGTELNAFLDVGHNADGTTKNIPSISMPAAFPVVSNQATPAAWTELDFSSYVGAKATLIFCSIDAVGGTGIDIAFCPKGSESIETGYVVAASYFGAGVSAASIGVGRRAYLLLFTDGDGKVMVRKYSGDSNYSLYVFAYMQANTA